MLGVSLRPQTHAYALIKRYGEFTVNIPDAKLVRQIDACATMAGNTSDHFHHAGLTKMPSARVTPPIIGESMVSLECEVHETHALGSHALVLGEIVEVHADESIIGSDGKITIETCKPLVCCPMLREYRGVSERLEYYGFSKRSTPD